ncbi:MAG: type II toxin-antitoxin system death-on-curing family toxin [Thermoanaerobaculia bacterium]
MQYRWVSRRFAASVIAQYVSVYNDEPGVTEPIPIPSDEQIQAAAACVERADASLFGEPQYPSFYLKCAVVLYEVAKQHFFVNGNKRIATFLLLFLLRLNQLTFRIGPSDLADFVEEVAKSNPANRERVLADIEKRLHYECDYWYVFGEYEGEIGKP